MYQKFSVGPLHSHRPIPMFVIQEGRAAWAVIDGSYEPVNIAISIEEIAPLVVTVAIMVCIRFVHDQASKDANQNTFVLHATFGLGNMKLILTDENGGRLNRRNLVHNRFLTERLL